MWRSIYVGRGSELNDVEWSARWVQEKILWKIIVLTESRLEHSCNWYFTPVGEGIWNNFSTETSPNYDFLIRTVRKKEIYHYYFSCDVYVINKLFLEKRWNEIRFYIGEATFWLKDLMCCVIRFLLYRSKWE